MLCIRTCSTTRSFERANDAKIVSSRDAQYNTEESPSTLSCLNKGNDDDDDDDDDLC